MAGTTDIFDALYDSLSEARAVIRIGGQVSVPALCSGLERVREFTEQGRGEQIADTVRCKTSDLPATGAAIGDAVEVSVNGGAWIKVRVTSRRDTGGVTAFGVGSVNG
jgi:hypothetical protein